MFPPPPAPPIKKNPSRKARDLFDIVGFNGVSFNWQLGWRLWGTLGAMSEYTKYCGFFYNFSTYSISSDFFLASNPVGVTKFAYFNSKKS
jgi:hypothetical protein